MASLYLVRHGQGSFGTDNYDRLSTLGHRQAELAGTYFAQHVPELEAIYCGSLQRQNETARGILKGYRARNLAVPELQIDARFDEIDIDGQIEHLLPAIADPEGELRMLAAQA